LLVLRVGSFIAKPPLDKALMMAVQSRKRGPVSRIGVFLRKAKDEEYEVDELDKSHRFEEGGSSFVEESTTSKLTCKTEEDEEEEEETGESRISDHLGGNQTDVEVFPETAIATAAVVEEIIQENIPLTKEEEPQQVDVEAENHVRFSSVEVREYPICMGDNPSSFRGVPISMGWDFFASKTLPVDDFELRPRRLQMQEFRMAPLQRVLILKRVGYSGHEIKEGTAKVNELRARRQRTKDSLRFTPLYENSERVKRGILNQTLYRSRKKDERKYLKRYKKNCMNIKAPNQRHAIESRRLDDSIQMPEGAARPRSS
jgi:hypothetical protein